MLIYIYSHKITFFILSFCISDLHFSSVWNKFFRLSFGSTVSQLCLKDYFTVILKKYTCLVSNLWFVVIFFQAIGNIPLSFSFNPLLLNSHQSNILHFYLAKIFSHLVFCNIAVFSTWVLLLMYTFGLC